MERKYKEVMLFGTKVLLYERNAIDVLNLQEAFKTIDDDRKQEMSFYMIISATVLSDSLKINLSTLHWYNFFKKKFYKKLTPQYLLDNLSSQDLMLLGTTVYELEGIAKSDTDAVDEKKSQPQ